MARDLRTTDIIVRRSIADKLEDAFSSELNLLTEDMRSIFVDDVVTAIIERMKVLRAISANVGTYPLEISE